MVRSVLIGGSVQLRKPLTVASQAGLQVPLHIVADVIEVQDTMEIDLSRLNLPTDP